jgi:endonuclease/exonuclease/phosphatase family metal-dependent hydrolase
MVLAPAAETTGCRTVESAQSVALSFAYPDDLSHRQRLEEACAGVGPVVVASAADGSSPQTRSEQGRPLLADEIVVVSWNTYLGRGDLEQFIGQLRRGDFTAGARVDAFVLLFQEVFRSQIQSFARASSLNLIYAPARWRAGDREDRGAAILSTFPTADVRVVELPFEKHRRIAIAADVRGAGRDGRPWRLYVVNAHFDTNVGILRGGPSAARRRQARALMDAVAALPPPVLIGADLNTWWGDDEPAVKELRRAFPDATPLEARETWRGPLGAGNKLDYVFARGMSRPVDVRRLDSRFGSDHWPLLAVVAVR